MGEGGFGVIAHVGVCVWEEGEGGRGGAAGGGFFFFFPLQINKLLVPPPQKNFFFNRCLLSSRLGSSLSLSLSVFSFPLDFSCCPSYICLVRWCPAPGGGGSPRSNFDKSFFERIRGNKPPPPPPSSEIHRAP